MIDSINNNNNLSGKVDPLVIVQEIKIQPFYQMVYAQTRICPRK